MSDDNVIKFGKAKKALDGKRKKSEAATNRAKFGRTKAEKKRDDLRQSKHAKTVDQHKRDET